jgi:YtkA-like protein
VLALALGILAAGVQSEGCSRRRSPPLDISYSIDPKAPVVGPSTLTISLRDPSGRPVKGAVVQLEAHMTHPGMAPILALATEREAGTYEIPFAFTMPGDWALLVSAALRDGERIERRIDVANVRTLP